MDSQVSWWHQNMSSHCCNQQKCGKLIETLYVIVANSRPRFQLSDVGLRQQKLITKPTLESTSSLLISQLQRYVHATAHNLACRAHCELLKIIEAFPLITSTGCNARIKAANKWSKVKRIPTELRNYNFRQPVPGICQHIWKSVEDHSKLRIRSNVVTSTWMSTRVSHNCITGMTITMFDRHIGMKILMRHVLMCSEPTGLIDLCTGRCIKIVPVEMTCFLWNKSWNTRI